jgi:hypothetical protein
MSAVVKAKSQFAAITSFLSNGVSLLAIAAHQQGRALAKSEDHNGE